MLNDAEIRQISSRLKAELSSLDAEDEQSADDRSTVVLDQQSVGRLSRMDALQRQAMAEATQRRRVTRRQRIASALERIEEGEFGYCLDCGEEIAGPRLDLDATVPNCVSCAKG